MIGDRAVLRQSLFQLLDSSLSAVPPQEATVEGQWSTTSRRVYASADPSGSGDGPFVEVIDSRWTGTLSCAIEIGAIGFLLATGKIHWAKTPLIAAALPIQVTLSAYAGRSAGRATFSATIGRAFLPGVPVDASAGPGARILGAASIVSGRVTCLAEADGAAFFVAVFPRVALKVGRNHLWRLRDDVAATLPPRARELLTRRRSGTLDADQDS